MAEVITMPKISDTMTEGVVAKWHKKVGDKVEEDAAWYYPEPKEAAKEIKNYVAFYKGVEESS